MIKIKIKTFETFVGKKIIEKGRKEKKRKKKEDR